jgi:hypothetical protein
MKLSAAICINLLYIKYSFWATTYLFIFVILSLNLRIGRFRRPTSFPRKKSGLRRIKVVYTSSVLYHA